MDTAVVVGSNFHEGITMNHEKNPMRSIWYIDTGIVEAEKASKIINDFKNELRLEENERMLREELSEWTRFGFTQEEAMSLFLHNKYIRRIPASFLVQTFMRKLRNGMDRRRP